MQKSTTKKSTRLGTIGRKGDLLEVVGMVKIWLVDKFTYIGSSVSSTETDINT